MCRGGHRRFPFSLDQKGEYGTEISRSLWSEKVNFSWSLKRRDLIFSSVPKRYLDDEPWQRPKVTGCEVSSKRKPFSLLPITFPPTRVKRKEKKTEKPITLPCSVVKWKKKKVFHQPSLSSEVKRWPFHANMRFKSNQRGRRETLSQVRSWKPADANIHLTLKAPLRSCCRCGDEPQAD